METTFRLARFCHGRCWGKEYLRMNRSNPVCCKPDSAVGFFLYSLFFVCHLISLLSLIFHFLSHLMSSRLSDFDKTYISHLLLQECIIIFLHFPSPEDSSLSHPANSMTNFNLTAQNQRNGERKVTR